MTGIYIHTPFCRSKCSYCDFNSYAGREGLADDYADALIRSFQGDGRDEISSVYFGGGNPALLGLRLFDVWDACRDRWRIEARPKGGPAGRILEKRTKAPNARLTKPEARERMCDYVTEPRARKTPRTGFSAASSAEDAEVSMEMNPEDAAPDLLLRLRGAGLNRLSLGWQSLDDAALRALGRRHDADTALESLKAARRAGFENVNVDMMFGLPGQTGARWKEDLKKVTSAGPDHISVYALSVEAGTRLSKQVEKELLAGRSILPTEDEAADMYGTAVEVLRGAGFHHYEISNFALPGRECGHNLNYWRGGDYLGFGAGAHSHRNGRRWWNALLPEDFIAGRDREAGSESLTQAERLSERIFLGLRLTEGVDPRELRDEFKTDVNEIFGPALARLRGLGLITPGPRLALTAKGLPLANEVMVEFV